MANKIIISTSRKTKEELDQPQTSSFISWKDFHEYVKIACKLKDNEEMLGYIIDESGITAKIEKK